MDNLNLDELMDLAEVIKIMGKILSLTRLRDFLVEMDVKELSLPVYDPNRASTIGGHLADRPDQHLGARQPWGSPHGSPVDGSIWRKRSTRPPEHKSDEVEKRGSLRE